MVRYAARQDTLRTFQKSNRNPIVIRGNIMENKFKQLDNESVVSFGSCTLRTQKFFSSIYEFFINEGWERIRHKLYCSDAGRVPEMDEKLFFIQGIDCEVLQPGKNWKKGKFKIKIALEFQPDEPEIEAIPENTTSESSLDDIRRKLNQVN